jgi:mono/diheme cytochrome c family protein
MKPTICRPAARLVLGLGLVAGAWLMPPPAATSAETALPPGAATATPGLAPPVLAQAEPEPAGNPVSYASDQADRGKDRFDSDCEECHGGDLKGGLNGGPPLRGLAFEEKYFDGLPASIMFGFMSSAMPPNSPGRYSAGTYADLMAYILKRNGYGAGAPLPSDLEALDLLIMEK